MSNQPKPVKQYQFRMRCVVDKVVTVEATSEAEATRKAETCDWLDEREDGMSDWEIKSACGEDR